MTVNLEDRAGSEPEMTGSANEVEEPRLGGTDIFRGGLVIGLALLIGGFVMLRGLTQDSTTADADTTASTDQAVAVEEPAAPGVADSATTAPGGADDSTTSIGAEPGEDSTADPEPADTEVLPGKSGEDAEDVAATLRPPAEVRVLVLNGAAQRQGVAGRGSDVLKAASYNTAAPKNADKTSQESVILYLDDYEAEALAVAKAFGPDLTAIVQEYDSTNPPIDDLQSANVIVVIGEDDIIPIP